MESNEANNTALAAHIEAINAKSRAWAAEAPESRFVGSMVTDIAHWNDMDVHTPAQFDHYLNVSHVYDLHKEVWGFKPDYAHLMEMSPEDLVVMENDLSASLESKLSHEAAEERQNVVEFEVEVAEMLEIGAQDRRTAIRWILDAEELGAQWTGDYATWRMGLPKTYVAEFEATLSA